MNIWKPFSEPPADDLPLRVIDAYGYIFPATLRMHDGKLQYRFEDYVPWEGLCRLGTQSVAKHYQWCYASELLTQETPRPRSLDQSHFLAWLSAYKPTEHNSLLAEYYDFCKDNPEQANTL